MQNGDAALSYFAVTGICSCTGIVRPHRSTAYVDGQNDCTDRDAVWVEDSSEPKEPCIIWGSRSPMGKGNFEGGRGVPL